MLNNTIFFSCFMMFQINDDKIKLAFSMKAVNQGTGRDLDPNNVMAEYVVLFKQCFFFFFSILPLGFIPL